MWWKLGSLFRAGWGFFLSRCLSRAKQYRSPLGWSCSSQALDSVSLIMVVGGGEGGCGSSAAQVFMH